MDEGRHHMARVGAVIRRIGNGPRTAFAVMALVLVAAAVPALAATGTPPTCEPASITTLHGVTGFVTASCVRTADGASTVVSYAVTQQPAHGELTDGGAGNFSWTPPVDFAGTDSFKYTATDDAGNTSAPQTVSLTSTNQAPTCENVEFPSPYHSGLTFVWSSCVDPDADPLTYDKASDAAHGTAAITSDGLLSYTANSNYTGPDAFGYRANDGVANSNTATASITVANAAPSCVDLTGGTLHAGNAAHPPAGTSGTVAFQCSDGDGDPLTFAKRSGPTHGTATVDADGSYSYQPANGYTGPDSFAFTAADGQAPSAQATVSFTVANAAPDCSNVFQE